MVWLHLDKVDKVPSSVASLRACWLQRQPFLRSGDAIIYLLPLASGLCLACAKLVAGRAARAAPECVCRPDQRHTGRKPLVTLAPKLPAYRSGPLNPIPYPSRHVVWRGWLPPLPTPGTKTSSPAPSTTGGARPAGGSTSRRTTVSGQNGSGSGVLLSVRTTTPRGCVWWWSRGRGWERENVVQAAGRHWHYGIVQHAVATYVPGCRRCRVPGTYRTCPVQPLLWPHHHQMTS